MVPPTPTITLRLRVVVVPGVAFPPRVPVLLTVMSPPAPVRLPPNSSLPAVTVVVPVYVLVPARVRALVPILEIDSAPAPVPFWRAPAKTWFPLERCHVRV